MSNKEIKEYNVMLNNEQVKVLVNELNEKDKEIERLENIIKEVREYIGISEEDRKLYNNYDVNGIKILEILDKENKE